MSEKKTLKNIGIRMLFIAWAAPLALFILNSQVNIVPAKFVEIVKPIYPATILAFGLVFLAAREYFSMLSTKFSKNLFWGAYIWLFITLCGSIVREPMLSFTNSIYLLLIFTALESFFIGKGTERWKRASLFFIGVIFLYLAGDSLLRYLEPEFMNIWNFPTGNKVGIMPYFAANLGLITVLCAIFFCDGMAYIFGSLFGKHHFTDISPKKTIEGAIGGFFSSVIVMTVVFASFGNHEVAPIWLGAVLGIVIGIFAQIGDLFVSLTKRYFAVKDASNLIPGHGGILDRFDSLFFTSPFVHIIIVLALKLAS